MALFPRKIFHSNITNKKGFTLIEIVVAALIIAALSGGLLCAFWGSQYFLNRARHRIQVYNLAVEALDKLKSNYQYLDSKINVADGYLCSDIGCVVAGEMAAWMPLETDFTYDVEEPQVNGYKQITVKVHWNEPAF
jgi:prepilin-type N-terminal cleavage/methylation domain-containing protein